jgi:hypothetical protein
MTMEGDDLDMSDLTMEDGSASEAPAPEEESKP